MSDATFSADEIVNKTLIARRTIKLYRDAMDAVLSQPYATVASGQPIGVVYAWLSPKEGRSTLWWMFQDANNGYYYTPHIPGAYDISSLKDQGAITVLEKKKLEEAQADLDNLPWYELLIKKYGGYVAGAGVLYIVAPTLIHEIFNLKKPRA